MLRTALLVAIIVVASSVRAQVPQLNPAGILDVKCATPEERSAAVQQWSSSIDWFLSRLDVPADIAKQLDDVDWGDPAAHTSAFTHPWFRAHLIRAGAPHLKSQLPSLLTETNREARLKEAIAAYGDSAGLAFLLREHARINPDQHITDLGTWNGQALMLEAVSRMFAICLVDVASEAPPKGETQK
jgi:hypothetical protein